MLFIDTETTGLGGSGTVAFLIGCASVNAEGLEVRQYLLPDYDDEAAMLEDLLSEFSDKKTLVSYNGATFDLPLMVDRMIINRNAKKIEKKNHVDLLHSARRLFKRRLQNCKLSNIEKELLGFIRKDDIPGYLVPSVYFEWLSSEELELMPGVLEHNRFDIVSLYFLVSHVASAYESEGETLDEIDDLHSLSKFYGRKKQVGSVVKVIDKIESIQINPLDEDILLFQAANFKKIGNFEKAEKFWETIAYSKSKESYRANIELSKLYEHRKKEIRKAIGYAQRAKEICPYGKSHILALDHRLERLNRKIKSQ